MTCDRCYRDATLLVPYTRDLNSNRVLMRCCPDCEREVIEQAGQSAVPGAPVGTPELAAPPDYQRELAARLAVTADSRALSDAYDQRMREAAEDRVDWAAKQP